MKSILLADHDEATQALLQFIFQKQGINTIVVERDDPLPSEVSVVAAFIDEHHPCFTPHYVDHLKTQYPEMRVVMMTSTHGILPIDPAPGDVLLRKPFSPSQIDTLL